ncbi:hypothetical protein [Anaplasma phagocytophilum]|uniref:hypothetical protein n=1 Tax=Anaplasma phagocytophilum TaxID=948 RepID=UPI00114CCF84|nr:hypothetical protein [Anaplasma phagocytophilum]
MSEEKNRRMTKKYILLQLLREISRPDINGMTELGNKIKIGGYSLTTCDRTSKAVELAGLHQKY